MRAPRSFARPLASSILVLALALCAAASALGGCSARKLVYGHADMLLYRQVDSTFDVDARQKAFAKDRLRSLLAWHAREELPRYAEAFGALAQKASDADGVSRADVDWAWEQAEGARVRLVDRAVPDAAEFLGLVRPEQAENVEQQNAKWNRKRVERLEHEGAEYAATRAREVAEAFDPWVGALTAQQDTAVRDFVIETRPLEVASFAAARERQASFVKLLKAPVDLAARERTLRGNLPSIAPASNAFQARVRDLVVKVASLSTPAQKQRFVREMRAWQADFAELYRKYGTNGASR